MTDELVPYSVAVLAKDKGFDVECRLAYTEAEGNLRITDDPSVYDVALPTQSLLARWLREKHGLHANAHYAGDGIYGCDWLPDMFSSFEAAMEHALTHWLKTLP